MGKRVFIGLSEVAGYFGALAKGLEENGCKVSFTKLYATPFAFDSKPCAIEPLVALYRKFDTLKRSCCGIPKALGLLGTILLKPFIFLWAVLFHDVFIFSFFATFYNYHELRLLKLLGKKIIYVFLGSDARPGYLSGIEIIHKCQDKNICSAKNLDRIHEQTRQQLLRMRKVERFADCIINHPTTANLSTKPFVSLLASGFTCMAVAEKTQESVNNNTITIVHAPSLPEIKGTEKIRAIVEELKKDYPQIKLIELTGVPHNTVLETLKNCDFVMDEVYSDNPLGGLGVEAAMFKKPVLSGGYYAQNILKDHQQSCIPPSEFVHPDNIKQAAKKLVEDANYRRTLGAKANEFVLKNWAPAQVAKRYIKIFENDIPDLWIYTPEQNTNVHGYGIDENMLRHFLKAYIKRFGTEGLFISHNKKLLTQTLDFVNKLPKDA